MPSLPPKAIRPYTCENFLGGDTQVAALGEGTHVVRLREETLDSTNLVAFPGGFRP
jgi:hypothetical protein